MKTVFHAETNKPVVIKKAAGGKPAKWACIACPVCRQALECDLDEVMNSVSVPAHGMCYELVIDIEPEIWPA